MSGKLTKLSLAETAMASKLFIALVASTVLSVNSVSGFANAQEQEQEDISVTEPTRKLTVQWWQWVMSIPAEDNPLLDTTGEKCQEGDMGDIFFLVGTLGGSAERECTISEGQEILFQIITRLCIDKPGGFREPGDFPDPGNFSTPKGRPGSCQENVESFIDQASNLEVTIDGVSIENLEDFRVLSYPFPLKLQEDNLFELPSGTYIGISDGYWILIESLPEGEHTIHFAGQVGDELTVDVTYHLTVE
jgi:hypothetical protein